MRVSTIPRRTSHRFIPTIPDDVGRVEMQSAAAPGFMEELTNTIRALGPNRGVLELSWGDRVMSAPFGVGAAR